MIDTKIKAIVDIVSEHRVFEGDNVFKISRKREIIIARQMIHYFMRKLLPLTYESIGEASEPWGNTYDHCTVINSEKKIKDLIDTEPKFREEVYKIESIIRKDLYKIEAKERKTKYPKPFLELRMSVLRALRKSHNENILKNELIELL